MISSEPLTQTGRSPFVPLWLAVLAMVAVLAAGPAHGADLSRLLLNGGQLTLDPGTTYTLDTQFNVPSDTVIHGNGATIVAKDGPLMAAGVSLQIEQVTITSNGWGAVASVGNGNLIVKGSTISCPNGSAVYVDSSGATLENTTVRDSTFGINAMGVSHLTLTQVDFRGCGSSLQQEQGDLNWNGGTVTQADNSAIYLRSATATFASVTVNQNGRNSIAFNFDGTEEHFLHGVSINGSRFGVLVAAGTTTLDQNSMLQSSQEDGVGVGALNGARLVLRDSTIRGFMNGVDVQPAVPGSADIENCAFFDMTVSALSAVNASAARIARSYVQGTKMDGIYFENSTGTLVDSCQIMGSLNTGVTFLHCPAGGVIQNSLVQGSAHQGIAVTDGSAKIRITGNTLIGNIICNILVGSGSNAFIQGNVLSGTPDFNVRLDGTRGTKLESNLIAYSQQGVEVKNGANPRFTLSAVANNKMGGLLAYGNASLALTNMYFRSNNSKDKTKYSVFLNEGATANLQASGVGPRGANGFYNNAGTTCDVKSTYWDATDGPELARTSGGSGALVDWNEKNGSKVVYTPYFSAPPVVGNWINKAGLSAAGTLSWQSSAGVSISLVANPNSPALSGRIVGALRAADTSLLKPWKLPMGLMPGQVYSVWIAQDLRVNISTGSLVFSVPGYGGPVSLKRRTPSGSWASVPAVWDPSLGTLTYRPDDPHNLNGTFAVIQG